MRPLKFLVLLFCVIAFLFGALAAGVALYGREALWEDVFGPPDLGSYDFDKPSRAAKPNDALICPDDGISCQAVRIDARAPFFSVDAGALYAQAKERIAALPHTVIIEERPEEGYLRAIVRTPLMRFPDTLSLKVRQDNEGRSTLFLYSRSQIGYTDLGANKKRAVKILKGLKKAIPFATMPSP